MRIGNKAFKFMVTGIVSAMSFLSVVAYADIPKKSHTHKKITTSNKSHTYKTVVTILGKTDIAPDYRHEPIVFETSNNYFQMPYHEQQSNDFYGKYTDANAVYSPLLDTLTVITVSAGAGIAANLGISQTLFALGNNYVYQANHNAQSRALLGAFIGQEYQHSPRYAFQFGLAYYQPASAYSVKGTLLQGPNLFLASQSNYGYNVITRQLLLEGKFLTSLHERYHPYVSLGLGEAFNNVFGYQISNPALITPLYTAARNRSFAYRVGFGMDVEMIPHLRLGLGYRFADVGRLNLGSAFIKAVPITPILKQSHLYTNELLGQLSYLF